MHFSDLDIQSNQFSLEGWLSEDELLIMSKEGITYVDVELVCLKFDEFLKEYNLSIHQIDGKRLLRWMRHVRDHQGEWNMDNIESLGG